MNRSRINGLFLVAVVALTSACVGPYGDTVAMQRVDALRTRDEVVADLGSHNFEAAAALKTAPGYIVMKGFSMHPGLFTIAKGYAVIVNNKTKTVKYANFFRLGVGPGLAVKSYRAVVVINDEADLTRLGDSGSFFGLLSEASFKFGDFGGGWAWAADFASDSSINYWTDTGVALELIVLGGGWVWGDDDLNEGS